MSTEFAFPKPNSMIASDAAKWYISMIPQIPQIMIDEPCPENDREIPVEEFKAHWAMKSRLRLAAVLALFDQSLVDEFLKGFPLPSANEYLGEAFASTQGKSAFKLALSNLLNVTGAERRVFNPELFVHVGNGLYKKPDGF